MTRRLLRCGGYPACAAHIDTAFEGQQITLGKAQGLRPTGAYTAKNEGIVSAVFRAQRSFATGD